MAEWFSIEVFSGDKLPASAWRYSYEDALTEAAASSGAVYWDWHDSAYGVVFEVCFAADDQWAAFRALPTVVAALDAVPDPVNGLLVYRGRGGAAGSRKPRSPRPAPGAAALESRRSGRYPPLPAGKGRTVRPSRGDAACLGGPAEPARPATTSAPAPASRSAYPGADNSNNRPVWTPVAGVDGGPRRSERHSKGVKPTRGWRGRRCRAPQRAPASEDSAGPASPRVPGAKRRGSRAAKPDGQTTTRELQGVRGIGLYPPGK